MKEIYEAAAKTFNEERIINGVNFQYVLQSAFIQGCKWQGEKSKFTADDMINFAYWCDNWRLVNAKTWICKSDFTHGSENYSISELLEMWINTIKNEQ